MECISALSQDCPRVSDLWLSVEEEVAWTVDQAAVHHQEGRAAGQSSRSLLVDYGVFTGGITSAALCSYL